MHGLSEILRIKVAASTAYHPQMDSQTEHVNQEVEQFLRLFVTQRQDDWYDWLLIAEFAYNKLSTTESTLPPRHPHSCSTLARTCDWGSIVLLQLDLVQLDYGSQR